MMPPCQRPAPEKEKNRPLNGPPLNLWKHLEPDQQKLLAQQWGQLMSRMQLARGPNKEARDAGN